MFGVLKNRYAALFAAMVAALLPMAASAEPTVYDTIGAAVDFSGAITLIGLVAVALAGVYVLIKGARLGLSFLR